MVDQTVPQETRPGVIFTGDVGQEHRGYVPVKLFVEGRKKSVGVLQISVLRGPSPENFVDQAFQIWVSEGRFLGTIKNPTLLTILATAQRERLNNTPWYRLTFRFLRAAGSTNENPRFILTTDKNDLPYHYKHILEIGEEAVQKEEADQEETRHRLAKEEKTSTENLRAEHAPLILTVVKAAIDERSVTTKDVQKLLELGLLKPSTAFRGGAQFPGESLILWYDYTEGKTRHTGYIGFDSKLQLISIDERFPKMNQVYLN
jgi:hypothetical protein